MKKILSMAMVVVMAFTALAVTSITSFAAPAPQGIVQDGLYAWYDGSTHFGSTWVDKKGNNHIENATGSFEQGKYVLYKQEQYLPLDIYKNALCGAGYTVEMSLAQFKVLGSSYGTLLASDKGTTVEKVSFFLRASTKELNMKTSGLSGSNRPKVANAEALLNDATVTFVYNMGGDSFIYINGEVKNKITAADKTKNQNADRKDSIANFVLCDAADNKCTLAEFKELRFYNRALTAEEIAQNYAVDTAPASTGVAEGLVLKYGTVYAAPGTTAYVPVYVSADKADAKLERIRNFEINPAVDGSIEWIGAATQWKDVVTGGTTYNYSNASGVYGSSSATGESFATLAQYCAVGGAPITYIPVQIPAEAVAGTVYTVDSKAPVDFVSFEDSEFTLYKQGVADGTMKVVAGNITVVPGVAEAPAYTGTGVYNVPTFDEAGKSVTSIGASAFNGFNGTLVIPASVQNMHKKAFNGATLTELVIKDTMMEAVPAGLGDALWNGAENPVVYYLKQANGMDKTFTTLTNEKGNAIEDTVVLKNVLTAGTTVLVSGNKVTAYGGLAVADLGYGAITTEMKFVQGGNVVKVKKYTTDQVYTTLTGVASSDAETAGAQGIQAFDGKLLTGVSVSNVPAGTYDVTVTIYATVEDKGGNTIVVCSDAVTQTITVNA